MKTSCICLYVISLFIILLIFFIQSPDGNRRPRKIQRLNLLDDSDTQDPETNLLLLKYFLKEYIASEKIESNSFRAFVHSLNKYYELPSAEKLKEIAQNYNSVPTQTIKLCRYLILISKVINDDCHAVCIAIDTQGNPVYIDHTLKSSVPDTMRSNLQIFLEHCITYIINEYNVKISFVLYDSPVLLSEKIEKLNVYLVICLKMFLEYIKFIDAELAQKADFVDIVDQIKNDLSLAEASEKILKIFSDNYELLNDRSLKAFTRYLNPVVLAANYFHHTFKGKLFEEFNQMNCDLQNFLIDELPNEAFEGLGYYNNNSKIFAVLKNKELDLEKYWSVACSEFPSLGCYAKDIIRIKANPNFDLINAIKIVNNYNSTGNCDTFKNVLAMLINN